MRSKLLLFLFAIGILLTACNKDEELTVDLNAKLSFSSDQILFDTVFTSIGSTSRRLKVYNRNEKAIDIENIILSGGATSPFILNINGIATSETRHLKINGKDSINIFVKVNINPSNENIPFIVQDTLKFDYNGQKQAVELIAFGQNAVFVNSATITNHTVWDGNLPYIVYKSVTVAKDVNLTIKPGTKVLFHGNATMSIMGTLSALGTKKDNIVFTSDRLEQLYAEETGQWNGIHFYPESKDSQINYAVIKNGVAGITVDSLSKNANPKLLLTNSVIKNMEVVGFLGYQTELTAFNNLFFNCGQYLLYGAGGGKYNLKQNTFAGYNPLFARKTAAVYLSDFISTTQSANLNAEIYNNIIWGYLNDELLVEKKATSTTMNLSVKYNLIKSAGNAYQKDGNILNTDPNFLNPDQRIFRLQKSSPANNVGFNLTTDAYFNSHLSRDLQNNLRLFPSELGCYENN